MIYDRDMKVFFLLLVVTLHASPYQISDDEKEALSWLFGNYSVPVVVGESQFTSSEISHYNPALREIFINPSKVGKFRSTFAIVHETLHAWQWDHGVSAQYTSDDEDYAVILGEASGTERQAEAARILAIDHLQIWYFPSHLNDDLLNGMDDRRRELLWAYLIPLGLISR